MPFISNGIGGSPEHVGYVAGRYRDGSYSDAWTDVRRCADRTFTAYAPACTCGWRGPTRPVTDIAHMACRRAWASRHIDAESARTDNAPTSTTIA